jgi:hypothetical protein
MRPRLFGFLGALAVAGLLAAPVSAAPASNDFGSFTGGHLFSPCTNEYVDNSGSFHIVNLGNGYFHLDTHFVGVGELSGATYVGNNEVISPARVNADGTVTVDVMASVKLTSQGPLPNQIVTIRNEFVYDANGNLISQTLTFTTSCPG